MKAFGHSQWWPISGNGNSPNNYISPCSPQISADGATCKVIRLAPNGAPQALCFREQWVWLQDSELPVFLSCMYLPHPSQAGEASPAPRRAVSTCISPYAPGGFPDSVVKGSTWTAGDAGLIPGLGRSPGEGHGNPLQYSCLGNPMDKGAWWVTVQGCRRVGHNLATKQQHIL